MRDIDDSNKQKGRLINSNSIICTSTLINHPTVSPEHSNRGHIIESVLQISKREVEIDVSISPSSDSRERIVISTHLTQTDCNAIYEIQPDHLMNKALQTSHSDLMISSPLCQTVKKQVEISHIRTPPHPQTQNELNLENRNKEVPQLKVTKPFPSSTNIFETKDIVDLESHSGIADEIKNYLTIDIPTKSVTKPQSVVRASESDSSTNLPVAKNKNEIIATSSISYRAHPLLIPSLNHIPSPYSSPTESSESGLDRTEQESQTTHSAEDRALFFSKYGINPEVFDLCRNMASTKSEEIDSKTASYFEGNLERMVSEYGLSR